MQHPRQRFLPMLHVSRQDISPSCTVAPCAPLWHASDLGSTGCKLDLAALGLIGCRMTADGASAVPWSISI